MKKLMISILSFLPAMAFAAEPLMLDHLTLDRDKAWAAAWRPQGGEEFRTYTFAIKSLNPKVSTAEELESRLNETKLGKEKFLVIKTNKKDQIEGYALFENFPTTSKIEGQLLLFKDSTTRIASPNSSFFNINDFRIPEIEPVSRTSVEADPKIIARKIMRDKDNVLKLMNIGAYIELGKIGGSVSESTPAPIERAELPEKVDALGAAGKVSQGSETNRMTKMDADKIPKGELTDAFERANSRINTRP